jgi:hypothetical protein
MPITGLLLFCQLFHNLSDFLGYPQKLYLLEPELLSGDMARGVFHVAAP